MNTKIASQVMYGMRERTSSLSPVVYPTDDATERGNTIVNIV